MSEPTVALAPWIAAQRTSLLAQRGHAWLLQGPSGLGQYALGLELVRAWLCDAPTEQGACGHCSSCHAIDVRTHADLCVLMPEVQMMALGWPLSEKAQADIDDKKRKPSKEIRVEAMRDMVAFAQRTSARGRGTAVLVYPAERMNTVTANALLKTLEEPAGDVRFVLASEAAHQLLPTIRSRCLGHTMVWPAQDQMLQWLQGQGVADAVQLRGGDALQRMPPCEQPGVMLLNPPYGERIAAAGAAGRNASERAADRAQGMAVGREEAQTEDGGEFFSQLASHWKKNYAGWQAWMLTPDLKLPGKMRLKESRRVPMWNGPIECRLFRFDMIKGAVRDRAAKPAPDNDPRNAG